MHDFESYLDTIVLVDEMLCITGDFNLHIDNPTDTYGCQFSDLLSSYGLVNHITFPTHKASHTLDLVITRNNQEMEPRSIKPGYFQSDHCFVCVEIVIALGQMFKTKYCPIARSNPLISPLLPLNWILYVRIYYRIYDLNELTAQYNCRLLSFLDKHAPVTTKTLSVHPKVPWFSPTINNLK